MQKLFTICPLLIIGLVNVNHNASFAQDEAAADASIKKGTFIIGSYFDFSSVNSTKNIAKGFNTSTSTVKLGADVTVGIMASDHWGLLLNTGFSNSNSTVPEVLGTGANAAVYNFNTVQNDFSISPSVRYYKLVNQGYYVFIQTAVKFTTGTLTVDALDKNDNLVRYDFSTHGFGMGISPGFSAFISKKLSTEIAIGMIGFSLYNGSDSKGNTTQTNTFQSLFYQNSISLGFVYYL